MYRVESTYEQEYREEHRHRKQIVRGIHTVTGKREHSDIQGGSRVLGQVVAAVVAQEVAVGRLENGAALDLSVAGGAVGQVAVEAFAERRDAVAHVTGSPQHRPDAVIVGLLADREPGTFAVVKVHTLSNLKDHLLLHYQESLKRLSAYNISVPLS